MISPFLRLLSANKTRIIRILPWALAFVFLFANPARATAPPEPQEPPTPAPVVAPVEREYTKQEMVALATQIALKNDLNAEKFIAVIGCESNWNTHAVGDNGTSFGLAQLHHPIRDWGVTREEAQDPGIALRVMAKAWTRGQQSKWTCYNNLYAHN